MIDLQKNDLIGLILWNNHKKKIINLIKQYIEKDSIKLEILSEKTFDINKDKASFVRGIYYPEFIKEDNIKIKTQKSITLITILDKNPIYELEKSSSGISIYTNINGLNLKRFLRFYYNWTYIHSTDNLEQYFLILYHLKKYGMNLDELNKIYNNYLPNQCRSLVFPKSNNEFNNINTHPKSKKNMDYYNDLLYVNIDKINVGIWEYSNNKIVNKVVKLINHPVYNSLLNNDKELYNKYINIEKIKAKKKYNRSFDKFIDLEKNFNLQQYNTKETKSHIKLYGLFKFNKKNDPKWNKTKIEIIINDYNNNKEFVYYNLYDRLKFVNINSKIIYFIDDGLHRCSIIKKINKFKFIKSKICNIKKKSYFLPYLLKPKNFLIIIGRGSSEKFPDKLKEYYKLKKENIIDNVLIEKNDLTEKFEDLIKKKYFFELIENIYKFNLKTNKKKDINYHNEMDKYKKNKINYILKYILKNYNINSNNKIYTIITRFDTFLSPKIIRQFKNSNFHNNNLNYKIWIPSYDLLMPFYCEDLVFGGEIHDILNLTKINKIKNNFYGCSHIRFYIEHFINKYPILKCYISNQSNILYNSRGKKGYQYDPMKNLFYKRLLNCWWYILKNHFHVFSHEEVKWDDNVRSHNFYNKNKHFDYKLNILNEKLLFMSKKQDKTLYFNNNIPDLNIISKEYFLKFKKWYNPYKHFNKFYDFIEELNFNKIKYVIIRGYWKLPETPDTDLDIVSHPDNYDEFIKIVKKYWEINSNSKTPKTFYKNGIKCEYTQWWTTGKKDKNIENNRFTMDTYSFFFFRKHVLSKKFTDYIFTNCIDGGYLDKNYYTLKTDMEILLLGYRNYFEIRPKNLPFKNKHKIIINKSFNFKIYDYIENLDEKSFDKELKNVKNYLYQNTKILNYKFYNCILITHQFIKNDESENWKYDVFDFCINHYRKNNKNAYIILTGHGKKPKKKTLKKVDWYYWNEDIIESEIGKGHPKLVTIGLNHAKEKGFEYVLKTRTDSINLIENICLFCLRKIYNHKKLLNVHYNKEKYELMDLFTFGKVTDLLLLYNPKNWNTDWSVDGTGPVARNYIKQILKKKLIFPFSKKYWIKNVQKNILIVNPLELNWLDLRKNKNKINFLIEKKFKIWKKFVWSWN